MTQEIGTGIPENTQQGQIVVGQAAKNLLPAPARFLNIFSRPEIHDKCYQDEKIVLDGHVYVNCRFERCVLDISSANYDLIGCVIDLSCTLTYTSSVADVLRFFEPTYPWANQHLPAFFVPTKNDAGAIVLWLIGKEY